MEPSSKIFAAEMKLKMIYLLHSRHRIQFSLKFKNDVSYFDQWRRFGLYFYDVGAHLSENVDILYWKKANEQNGTN